MKPLETFAEYNKENILGNFLQAETHLKNLRENSDPEWAACIHKHFLEAQLELAELQAHEPKNQVEYKEMMMNLRKLRNDNINGLEPKEAISRLREIRGKFEKYVRGHDTEKCESCIPLEDVIKEYLREPKHLNRGSTQRLNISLKHGGNMVKESITNSLIGGFVGKGISTATPMVITGATFGIANKTLANLGIGVVLEALAMYGKLPAKAELPLTAAGGFLIADEVVDLVMGMVPAPAPAAVAAPIAAVAPTAAVGAPAAVYRTGFGAPGVSPQYADGSLIFVD